MTSTQMTPNPSEKQPVDGRDIRHMARHERREMRRQLPMANWIGGATLIVIGLTFLLKNVLNWSLADHWWAALLLIPALTSLATAWQLLRSQKPGHRRAAFGALTGGSMMLILAVTLFLGLDWQKMWPLILIAVGISAIISRSGTAVSATRSGETSA